jgi:4-amino-4-deoxy-L-arabinose transferase-like glycosyltransferase
MYGLYMNFRKHLQQNPHLLLLIIIVLLIILIIGRPYNLLVNDDGIFIRNIKNFYDGNFTLHPLTAPTFYFQAVTGFITTKIFGFSFENLRLLNIFFAFLSSLLIFFLIKSITNNKLTSLLVALAFVSNPFFWFLSYSYMTEIHFILFATIALFSFYKYLQNNSYSNVILTSIAVSLLFLVRQIGLIFAISFFLSIIITNKKITKKDLIILFLPVLTFFWYQNFSITAEYAEAGITETLKNFFDYSFMINIFFKRVFDSSVYIGLFSLPRLKHFHYLH